MGVDEVREMWSVTPTNWAGMSPSNWYAVCEYGNIVALFKNQEEAIKYREAKIRETMQKRA